MLCGIAWDLTSIVVFRIIQGMGGGTLIPMSQALLRETFPHDEQGTAMGIYGLGTILGPAFGPTLGGWLTDSYSWRWIFYINVPVGVLNILLIMQFIKDPPYLVREKGKLDFAGLFFMSVGLGALQIMLERGNQKDWFSSNLIRYLAIATCIGLALFVWRELTTDRPAVNLRILKDINFTSGTFLGGILGLGLFSSIFILPLFLQQLLHYPAYNAGLILMPRSLAMAVSMPLGGRLYNKAGPKLLVGTGLLLNAVSFYELSRMSLNVGYWDMFFPQFLQGIGFGFIFVSLSTAVLSTIDKPLHDRCFRTLQRRSTGLRQRGHCFVRHDIDSGRNLEQGNAHRTRDRLQRYYSSNSARFFFIALIQRDRPNYSGDRGLETAGRYGDETGEHAIL